MNEQTILSTVALSLILQISSLAQPVQLQQPTATFSQTEAGDYSVARAIDGIVGNELGWAVSPGPGSIVLDSQTAVFETVSDVGFTNGTVLIFTLHQSHTVNHVGPNEAHNLGRFRLSITTDARDTFADGLQSGGDVSADWIVLDPISFVSGSGTALAELPDHSILATGPNPSTDIYTVTAIITNTGITGIRLEALEDPSLPHDGPGRRGENGNFVLTEFQVSVAPVSTPGRLSIRCAAEICWLSTADKRYQVQFASAIDSKEWFDLGGPVQGNDNEICVYDSTQSKEKRFYRYVELSR